MRVEFLNKELQKLYEMGKSRKYKLEDTVCRRFVAAVNRLVAALSIHDLWKQPGFKFEKLQGYEKRFSMRISQKYRLEMEIDWQNPERTIGLIGIDELSKHYEDS